MYLIIPNEDDRNNIQEPRTSMRPRLMMISYSTSGEKRYILSFRDLRVKTKMVPMVTANTAMMPRTRCDKLTLVLFFFLIGSFS